MQARKTSDGRFGFRVVKTKAGFVGLAYSGNKLCRLVNFERSRAAVERSLRSAFPRGRMLERAVSKRFEEAIERYGRGERVPLRADVLLDGLPPFSRKVLEACARIPLGETVSYGRLAARIGAPRAARAVGNVMARNPLPLVIPCHRVVRSGGGLGNYGGGTSLKERLLRQEGALP